MHAKPSLHGRVVSETPSELQSAGEVQQTTGLGREHAGAFVTDHAITTKSNGRIRAACRGARARVNELLENVLG